MSAEPRIISKSPVVSGGPLKRFTNIVVVLFFFLPGLLQADNTENSTLALVDGEVITAHEVDNGIAGSLAELREQVYNLRRQKLDAVVSERLLAKEAARRGLSVPALLDSEVTSKVGLVTEQEIERYYQDNKARLKGEQVVFHEQIRAYLQNRNLAAKRAAFVQLLRSKAEIIVYLKRPVFRTDVKVQGAPFKGLPEAPVTLVKFEDFQCPFCKQVQQTLTQLLARYDKQLRVVHRDFPINDLHPQAWKAHEAARCANDEGKFWSYHDKLYANAPKASPETLKSYAEEVGLNVAAFERCLNSGKYASAVHNDVVEATHLGITGTPFFFINGRSISGVQTFQRFAEIIEEELAREK
jgi:protein-disulfide isomerase